MIGLAHGAGKNISQLREKEKRLIQEHDIAIYVMGNFESCIKDKIHLFNVDVPLVVTGGPEKIDIPYTYVGNLGRRSHRLRHGEEIRALRQMIDEVTKKIADKRAELSYDPPIIPPVVVKDEIEKKVVVKDEIEKKVEEVRGLLAPMPIVTQLDGLRIKMDYDRNFEEIENLKVGKYLLKDISYISKSEMKNYILIKLKSTSEVKNLNKY
jgi:putative methanogenesis marker protein 7